MHKLNNRGFSHHLLIAGIVVGVVIVGGFALVWRGTHNHAAKANLTTTNKNASTQSKINVSLTPPGSPSATSSSSATKTTPGSSSTTKSSGSPSTTSTANNSSSSQPASSGTSQTALSTLTDILTALQKNTAQANVTANAVTIPGPISDATGRPIVFTFNGETYFAYTQSNPPDFNKSAADLASSMALVKATVNNPALETAYLNKFNNLVAEDYQAAGYSTGGN